MENDNFRVINKVKCLLNNIHRGNERKVFNLCSRNILWKYNHNCIDGMFNDKIIKSVNTMIKPEEIQDIRYMHYKISKQFINNITVTGFYCILKSDDRIAKEYYFDYTIIFADGKAYYISIDLVGNDNIPTKLYSIITANETIYNTKETELLYVEAMGNHTLWHCMYNTIESLHSLKDVEDRLSDDFVKIHRSYIVNKQRVREIKRCAAIMENGDEIPIPYKKFVKIKQKLIMK